MGGWAVGFVWWFGGFCVVSWVLLWLVLGWVLGGVLGCFWVCVLGWVGCGVLVVILRFSFLGRVGIIWFWIWLCWFWFVFGRVGFGWLFVVL